MSEESQTPLKLLRLTEDYFSAKSIESPRVDAEILLAHILGCPRLDLYLRHDQPLDKQEVDSFRDMVRRRAAGQPVQHLTGEQDFYALKMQVSEKVLIPRPETEILVEWAFRLLGEEGDKRPFRICEIGTGSGAIAVALADGWPNANITATDLSLDALDVAKGNIEYHSLSDRVRLLQGDLFEALEGESSGFDLVISNPPYIRQDQLPTLSPEVIEHEPELALDGGLDGLVLIREIAKQTPAYLTRGGWLALEIGHDQGEAALSLLSAIEGYAECAVHPDLAGRQRVLVGKWIGKKSASFGTTV